MDIAKLFSKERGYLIGRYLKAPILVAIIYFIFYRGDSYGKKYVDEYINNSILIDVVVPKIIPRNRQETELITKIKIYRDEYQNKKCYYGKIAYSEKYKKYISIIIFEGFEYYSINGKNMI